MYDAASLSDIGRLQRANGELRIAFRRRGDATVLDDLRQVSCLKARFPRVEPEAWTTAVILNTSGGVAGGDRLDTALHVSEGARATITTQAAERFYRVLHGSDAAHVRTRIAVAPYASMEWLPQETLLFDRCNVDRRLDVELSDESCFLGVESLVFGRTAMGEHVRHGRLRDLIHVRRGGRLLLHDAIRLDGGIDALLARKAVSGGARAVATMVHVAPDAEATLDHVRAALVDVPAEGGASAWNGMLLTRILATTAAALRSAVVAVLATLRGPRPLPRVWQC
jgi:urease accessory protein